MWLSEWKSGISESLKLICFVVLFSEISDICPSLWSSSSPGRWGELQSDSACNSKPAKTNHETNLNWFVLSTDLDLPPNRMDWIAVSKHSLCHMLLWYTVDANQFQFSGIWKQRKICCETTVKQLWQFPVAPSRFLQRKTSSQRSDIQYVRVPIPVNQLLNGIVLRESENQTT